MPQDKKYRAIKPNAISIESPSLVNLKIQEYARLQGMMLYNFLALKSAVVPFTAEVMEMNKMGMMTEPGKLLPDLAERQKSAVNFQRFVGTYGKELFGSARYEGETLLAENKLFTLTHIPVKKGVKKRASMFHIGGFVPYSDNLFRLLPNANFFDRFIENGIDVYEMKCKSDTGNYNPQLLELSIESIIESTHSFSDLAFKHCGGKKMILEGYCGTGINTYTSYLADIEGMSSKFDLIVTFVSPVDAKKCTIFEQMHEILAYLNPTDTSVDGHTMSNLLDTIQERNFEKTPMGALFHGWKNKEYASIEKIEDLSHRQQSELAAWYWLSLKHGSCYPLSKDLYTFYSALFTKGVTQAGILPYEYKGKVLNLKDLKKTKVKVLVFLGDKDHLVNCHTADVLQTILGKQCEVIVHEKTGHVAYIFNPQRWNKDDPRAFKPDILETVFGSLPAEATASAKPASTRAAEEKPAKAAVKAKAAVAVKPSAPVKPVSAPAAVAQPVKAAAKPSAKVAATPKAAVKAKTTVAVKPQAPVKPAPVAATVAQPAKAAAKPAAKVAVTPKAVVKAKAAVAVKPPAPAKPTPAPAAVAKPVKAAAKPSVKVAAPPKPSVKAKPAAVKPTATELAVKKTAASVKRVGRK